MSDYDFTDEQKTLISAEGNAFFEACPGAGKTVAVVERFRRLTEINTRKGIALLSFSRAAVNEVKTRCSDNQESLKSPHFVGTFDSFINRFIVTPQFVSKLKVVPSYVDCWENIKAAKIRLSSPDNWAEYSLDWFELDDNFDAHLVIEYISGEMAVALKSKALERKPEIERQATRRIKTLMRNGLISSSEARHLMDYFFRQEDNPSLEILKTRFKEIIVDEAQDCGEKEINLLRKLHTEGVSIVLIGDLDQAIYEFRDATPNLLRAFVSEASLEIRPRLNTNHRSIGAICMLVNSLRTGSETDVVPANEEDVGEVCLFSFDENIEILARLNSFGLVEDIKEFIVLAHTGKDAREASGCPHLENPSNAKVMQIAYATQVLGSVKSVPKEREYWISVVERLLLGAIEDIRTDSNSIEKLCEDHGISMRWLRSAALFLSTNGKPLEFTREEFTSIVQAKFNKLSWPEDIELKSASSYLRKPPQQIWNAMTLNQSPQDTITLPFSTIHGVKGQEFENVLLVFPARLRPDNTQRTFLDHWEQNSDGEAKRVIYVGASRAKSTLVLAVHHTYLHRVQDVLTRDNVPHRVLQSN